MDAPPPPRVAVLYNLAAFEAALQSAAGKPGLAWEQRSEAAVRQFGLIERRYSFAA